MCTRQIDQSAFSLVRVINSFSIPNPPFFALLVIVERGPVSVLFLSSTVLGSVSREWGRHTAEQSKEGASRVAVCWVSPPSRGAVAAGQAHSPDGLWHPSRQLLVSHQYPSGQIPVDPGGRCLPAAVATACAVQSAFLAWSPLAL